MRLIKDRSGFASSWCGSTSPIKNASSTFYSQKCTHIPIDPVMGTPFNRDRFSSPNLSEQVLIWGRISAEKDENSITKNLSVWKVPLKPKSMYNNYFKNILCHAPFKKKEAFHFSPIKNGYYWAGVYIVPYCLIFFPPPHNFWLWYSSPFFFHNNFRVPTY